MKRVGVYDIETTAIERGKLPSIVHSISIKVNDEPIKCYTSHYLYNSDGNLAMARDILLSCDLVVGFNNKNFDDPTLEQYFGVALKDSLDLMILAKLIISKDELFSIDIGIENMPKNLYGTYSLKAFGYRLGDELKDEYSDWSRLTAKMVDYNKQDVAVTYRLYKQLLSMPNQPPASVLQLEQDVASIIGRQERYGFYFDIDKARDLNRRMLFDKFTLEKKLHKVFKPRWVKDGPEKTNNKILKRKVWLPNLQYKKYTCVDPFKAPWTHYKNGKIKLPKRAIKFFIEPHRFIIKEQYGVYQPIKFQPINLGSRDQIRDWLKFMYNFEFKTYTETGAAKVDADELEKMGEQGKDLRAFLKLTKDYSQLGGTDNSLIGRYTEHSGAIHGRVDTIGANTHRATHSSPNLAQIPAGGAFRELFIAPPGMKVVGADLANI